MLRIFAAECLFSLVVWAMQEVPRGRGVWTLAGMILVAASLPLLVALAHQRREPPARASARILAWGGTVFALAQFAFAIAMLIKPKVLDIGVTTLAAILAAAHGDNPYLLPIDRIAGGITDAGERFHGYKYLPVMMADYAPFCLSFGIRGIILTNIALQTAITLAIGSAAAQGGRRLAGLAAMALYLSLPFVAHQIFTRGVTDIAAILPLLAALCLIDTRPGWAGFLVGLSVATKLVPGIVALPCLLPGPGSRRAYLCGAALGLLPILPFAATAPDGFLANVILFNTLRPVDDTSWLFGLPAFTAIAARAAAALILLGIALRLWRQTPGLDERCAWTVLAILTVLAVGPDIHHNYYLWFLPFLAVLAGRAAIGDIAPPIPRAT